MTARARGGSGRRREIDLDKYIHDFLTVGCPQLDPRCEPIINGLGFLGGLAIVIEGTISGINLAKIAGCNEEACDLYKARLEGYLRRIIDLVEKAHRVFEEEYENNWPPPEVFDMLSSDIVVLIKEVRDAYPQIVGSLIRFGAADKAGKAKGKGA
jgi:hypothetical protein